MTSKCLKNRVNENKNSMVLWFVFLSGMGIFFTVSALFLTWGEWTSKIFFFNYPNDVYPIDTAMDFFNSINYVRNRTPYSVFNTLYPPLANLFFYCLLRFIPESISDRWANSYSESVHNRGTSNDPRIWQPALFMFIIFVMCITLAVFLVVKLSLERNLNHRGYTISLFAICALFSYGVLYALERGNIIIISCILCIFFVNFYDSENKALRILAIIALAVSAGLKMYPAVFGALLVYSKRKKAVVYTVLLGITMFILPFFFFKDGLSGLEIFIKNLTEFSSLEFAETEGLSFNMICNALATIVLKPFGVNIKEIAIFEFLPKLNVVVSAIILLLGFFLKKNWQRVLACTVSLILFTFQYNYIIAFLLIPLISLVCEEKIITRQNRLVFFTLSAAVVLLPIVDLDRLPVSLEMLRFQICLIILIGYLVFHGIKEIVSTINNIKIKKRTVQ